MSLTRNQIVILFAGVILIAGLVALLIYGSKKNTNELSGTINFWGVFDSPAAIGEVISAYRASQPKVSVVYRQIDPLNYENELINALASGRAPDVIMFHNSWLPKHVNKVAPINPSQISISQYRNLFPQVVEQDFAPDGSIYALPLYIDTLALFYNQDIFDNKSIAVPPKTWEEFEKLVPRLRELDKLGRIQKAAAAIGGSNRSINRAPDLVSLLMLQTGTQMVTNNFQRASFDSKEGVNALNFYTKFANPISPAFTWSDSFGYSLDSFSAGDTAIMFNYAYQAAYLKDKNPFLNFRMIPMLQPETRSQDVNYANYWGLAMTVAAQNKEAAQDFIVKVTSDPAIAERYLSATQRPPALRSLISKYLNDPEIGIFARQALTARSWPQIDNIEIDKVFSDMVVSVLTNRLSTQKAVEEATGKVSQLMEQRR